MANGVTDVEPSRAGLSDGATSGMFSGGECDCLPVNSEASADT